MTIVTAPIKLLWHMLSRLLEAVGRLLAVVIGILCLVTGVLLTMTIVGAIIGIPLGVFGGLLTLRGLF
ncbi:MAG: hypothetical protein SF123_08190 [Chloroflexota bacterium]|nr:hypothetical protein [Chloroflexota bacterium]